MPYYNKDPKRDHNFDHHPYGGGGGVRFRQGFQNMLWPEAVKPREPKEHAVHEPNL